MTIYAIKAPENEEDVDTVFQSLRLGVGRFGWSYIETANQRDLHDQVNQDGWDSLNTAEKDCYHDFLLNIAENDYAVYINVPVWGQCTLVKIEGEYYFDYDGVDFNHRFPVYPDTVIVFGRNDKVVHPALSARLKLRGRWWTIYAEEEFNLLLDKLQVGAEPAQRTPEDNLRHLSEEIWNPLSNIATKIHHTHPNKELESLVSMVFERVPGVRHVLPRRGRADRGADLLVELEFGSIPNLVQTLVVQVKSFEKELRDTSAIDDIRRAFEHHSNASMGLIVSTATRRSDQFQNELDQLQEESGKPVALLIGANLAAFCLHYGGDLLF